MVGCLGVVKTGEKRGNRQDKRTTAPKNKSHRKTRDKRLRREDR